MKCLLDTHTFIWMTLDSPELSEKARETIADSSNEIFLSPATCWEIAIKASIGKLNLSEPLELLINREINQNDLSLLPITPKHANAVQVLPFPRNPTHKDPFDRLLIAQATCDEMAIITRDAAFDAYHVNCIW